MISQSDRSQSDYPTVEPTVEPIPPRYWWLKRIALAGGILLVALFALRLWWGWEANRRLQAEIDRIIAAGEPIYPEDFDPKEEIPDDQNAARLLIGIDAAISLTPEQTKLVEEVRGGGKFTDQNEEQARRIVEANTGVFALIRQARGAPSVDWGMRLRSPVFGFMPAVSGQRQLVKLLSLSIRYHHFVGDDQTAVEQLRDALALARAVEQMPSLIPMLVGIAADGVVSQDIEAISSTLNISDNSSVQLPGRPCTRDDAEALLRDLLNEQARREAIIYAIFFERMSQLDLVRGLKNRARGMSPVWGAAAAPWASAWDYLITPLVELDGATMIRDCNLRLQAAAERNWVRAKGVLPKEAARHDTLGGVVHFLSIMWVPSLERAFLLHFRSLASRRLAGTGLAIRLYQVDHGHRPRTLAELIPEYLSGVPMDPFAGDGTSIRYVPNGPRAILYSVGGDGVNDEGRYAFRSGGGIDWDNLDMPFFLDGDRPIKPEDVLADTPSIQARENQKNADDDEGDADEDGESEDEP